MQHMEHQQHHQLEFLLVEENIQDGSSTIEYVQIEHRNAIDFGDVIDSMEPLGAFGCSNGHGGYNVRI